MTSQVRLAKAHKAHESSRISPSALAAGQGTLCQKKSSGLASFLSSAFRSPSFVEVYAETLGELAELATPAYRISWARDVPRDHKESTN